MRGTAKRVCGELRRDASVLQSEVDILGRFWQKEHDKRLGFLSPSPKEAFFTGTPTPSAAINFRPKCDLLEGFAGEANCSKTAPFYGLKALQPCDYQYGWSLHTKEGRRAWRDAVRDQRPLCITMAINCTEWCWYNAFVNYKTNPEDLVERQTQELPIVRLCL